MKQQAHTNYSAYNSAVKEAYFKQLKGTKQLLATVFQHELRCTLQRTNRSTVGFGTTVHEIVSPLVYLSLECNDGERLSIHFGFELFSNECEYSIVTSKFLRMLYRITAVENSTINIERSINTDHVITDCSALYEAIEDSHIKQHKFSLIAYKPVSTKRKQLMEVA
jgi:hypothetical protein